MCNINRLVRALNVAASIPNGIWDNGPSYALTA